MTGCRELEVPVGRLEPPLDLEVFVSATAGRLSQKELASSDLEALVAALEGHPLSLVLVAGQAGRSMTLAKLHRRLQQDGDAAVIAHELLGEMETKGTPDDLLRTKRLINSLNLSFAPLLSPVHGAAEIFLWLSHFPAGLRSDLVPSIFGELGDQHVALLLSHNLIELAQGRETRLLLPAPVRRYAKRRLAEIPDDRQEALRIATFRSLGQLLGVASARSLSQDAPQSLGLALREEPNLASLLPATTGSSEGVESLAGALVPWIYLMSRAGRPSAALRLGEQAAATIFETAPGTSAEANTRKALGDLYVRTDRLREAEDAYQSALPIYQQIEARLGEANTLQGLGRLAVAHNALPKAFDRFLEALAIQGSISDLLGVAGSYGYLARTARAASHLEKAIVIGGKAWKLLKKIEDRFGQRLALDDLMACFASLEDEDAAGSSMILAWNLARSMEEPSVEQRCERLRQILPDFDPESESAGSWLQKAEETLTAALARYEQALAARGEEDPFAPLLLR